jgi:hypothetical protein
MPFSKERIASERKCFEANQREVQKDAKKYRYASLLRSADFLDRDENGEYRDEKTRLDFAAWLRWEEEEEEGDGINWP